MRFRRRKGQRLSRTGGVAGGGRGGVAAAGKQAALGRRWPAVTPRNGFPGYVQVFSALIVIIAGAFVITIIYRVIQESRREKEVPTEAPVSAKSSVQVETQAPSSVGAGSKAPSMEMPQSKDSGAEDASLIVTEEEETED